MHVRATLNLDKALVERAQQATGIKDETALIHAGL